MADDSGPGRPRIRDRHVVLVAAAVVAAVLGLQVMSVFVPALRDALALAPLLIGVLVIVTLVVLARALSARRPPTG